LTPTLFVADPDHVHHFDDMVHVHTVPDAIRVITEGKRAVLPEDEYWQDRVREILTYFGAEDDWIDSVLRFALTGQT
jgi:hypothetical protein